MTVSAGLQSWRISYEINPIVFVGGVAGTPGSNVPISNYLGTPSQNLFNGAILSNSDSDLTLDEYFAHFYVVPGGQLIVNQFAHYPFLNQTIAANAIITQPVKVALRMVIPVKNGQTFANKLSIMTNLTSTLNQHIALGGMFNVATPSYFYTNCLLESLTDVSEASGDNEQRQFEWEWVFEQPLVSLQAATNVLNNLSAKIQSRTAMSGDPPSRPAATTVGVADPTIATALNPTAASAAAAGVSSTVAPLVGTASGQ